MEQLLIINREIEEELAQKIARGELDPITKKPLIQGNSNDKVSSILHGYISWYLLLLISVAQTLGLDRNNQQQLQPNHLLLCSRFLVISLIHMS